MSSLEARSTNIAHEFTAICNTSLEKLPVSKDLLRLAKCFRVEEKRTGSMRVDEKLPILTEIKYTETFNSSVKVIIMDLLNCLHMMLNLKPEAPLLTDSSKIGGLIIFKEFDEQVNDSDHHTLTKFLLNKFGDNHGVCKILKLCNQSIVVSFLGHLAEILHTQLDIRCKDVRGSWFIHIRRSVTDSENSPIISVIHKRTEQASRVVDKKRMKDLFKFSWELQITLDKSLQHLNSIEAKLLSLDWSTMDPVFQTLKENEISKIEKKFRSMFGHPSIDNIKQRLNAQLDETMKNNKKARTSWFSSLNSESLETAEIWDLLAKKSERNSLKRDKKE